MTHVSVIFCRLFVWWQTSLGSFAAWPDVEPADPFEPVDPFGLSAHSSR